MGQAPYLALPTAAYQPTPGQTAPAYAILITSQEDGSRQLMSSDGRVVRFANEYRAADVLGWVDQRARMLMEIVPYQPRGNDLPSEQWERLNGGVYVRYSERRRLARLGLAVA